MLKFISICLLALAQAVAFSAETPAAPTAPAPSVPLQASERQVRTTASWTCQAFYLPARSIWQRTVTVEYDGIDVRAMLIDGVAVYTFSFDGDNLMTAVDGERIQFDVAALTWTSDLRGLVSATGRCIP